MPLTTAAAVTYAYSLAGVAESGPAPAISPTIYGQTPVDLATAQTLAAQLEGTLIQAPPPEWGGGISPAPVYVIVMPDGGQIDAGALAYSRSQSDPQIPTAQLAANMMYWHVWGPETPGYHEPMTTIGEVNAWAVGAAQRAAAATPTPGPGAPASQAGTTAGGAAVIPGYQPDTAPQTLADQIKALARGESPDLSGLNPDQWNFYYTQATGTPAPTIEDMGYTRPVSPVSFEDWWARVQAVLPTGAPGAGAPSEPGAPAPGEGAFAWFFAQLKARGLAFLWEVLLYGGHKPATA